MNDIHQILKKYWGYDQFRPLQEEIILSLLAKKDTLALMPTGGGKSLCFQVPALHLEGVCIVISPLIALMQDQVDNLRRIGVKALALHSGMDKKEIDYALDRCVHGDIKLLYLSPERLQSELFQERYKRMNVSFIAVDEAHCISQWGYDFRPAYLQIAQLREIKPVTVLALTATATPDVVEDIQEKLLFRKKHVLQKSFVRDNLAYLVIHEENKRNRLLNVCRKTAGTGVVYVRNRKKTVEIADFLTRHQISAEAYHAGLSGEVRNQRQKNWTENKTRVIVATNAFGMGIDKPDVRFVVHLDLPEDLESYYQEAGRGGRDGKKAFAVVLFEKNDVISLEQKVENKFPAPDTIRKSYRALLNYLQLAAGSGQGASFTIDLPAIASTFNLQSIELYHSLKLLESEGFLTFNEAFYSPSLFRFIVSPATLYDYQLRNPELGEFTQLLLRSYSGIFENPVKIDENLLARRRNSNRSKVINQLEQLNHQQIGEYKPAKDSAMVTFTQPAQYDKNLKLSAEVYHLRKSVAAKKLQAMKDYLSPGVCRQKKLLHYFGEKHAKNCGQCDVCLEKNKSVRDEESIRNKIIAKLRQHPMNPHEISSQLSKYGQQNVLRNITWMVDEQLIYYRPDKSLAIKEPK